MLEQMDEKYTSGFLGSSVGGSHFNPNLIKYFVTSLKNVNWIFFLYLTLLLNTAHITQFKHAWSMMSKKLSDIVLSSNFDRKSKPLL